MRSSSFALFNPAQTFQAGMIQPPSASYDSRHTPLQRQMNELSGLHGVRQQGLGQFSSQALPTMTRPAMSVPGAGTDGVANMGQVIELKTIFRANEVFPGMLGEGGVAPLRFTEDDAILTEVLTFNEALPNNRAPRGRVTFGTAERRARSGTLRSFGSGIEFTYQFLKGRSGPLYLRLSIEQLNNGVVDHLLLMAYELLQNSHDWGRDIWARQISADGQRPGGMTVQHWFTRNNYLLGLMQKEDRPLEAVMSWVREQQRLLGVQSNALVLHHSIANYAKLNVPAYTEFFRAGQAGPEQARMVDDDAALRMHINGFDVNVVRANAIDDAQEFPFMENEVRYGEFYVFENEMGCDDEVGGDKNYPCWIEIYNQYTDNTWHRIKLIDAIENSGRFDDNGNFRDFSSGVYQQARPLYGDSYDDPFIFDEVSGGQTAVEHVNDLARRNFLSADRLRAMALVYKEKNLTADAFPASERAAEGRPDGSGVRRLAPSSRFTPVSRPSGGFGTETVSQAVAPAQAAVSATGADISNSRSATEAGLTGSWVKRDGSLILDRNRDAALVRIGAVRTTGATKTLDVANSNADALKAVAVMHNLAAPADDTQRAAQAALFTGLNMISTEGSVADVSANIGAFLSHMVDSGVLPAEYETRRVELKGDQAAVARAVSAHIGASLARGDGMYGGLSSRDYQGRLRAGAAADQPAKVAGSIAGSQKRIGAIYGPESDPITRQMLDGLPDELQSAAEAVLDTPLNLNSIRKMVAMRVPLPFKVVLLRPFIRLRTYGMIACMRGAQNIFYGMAIFSWADDGQQQSVRGVLSYKAGGFIFGEKTLFHLPDVLIRAIQSGMGVSWIKGGKQDDLMPSDDDTDRGDLIALLEPTQMADPNTGRTYEPMVRSTEVITAYGSFQDVELMRSANINNNEKRPLFANRAWMRAWFGIDPAMQGIGATSERQAAYGTDARSEHMVCWRGGSNHPNASMSKVDYRPPAGPFADFPGYGPGMGTAFQMLKRPRFQKPSRLEIMGH